MKKIIILGASLLVGASSLTSFASLTDKESLQKQLFEKIKTGDLDTVKRLLKKDVSLHEVNESGSTPLHFAVLFNRLNIVEYLITAGAVINAHNRRDGVTPLHDAVEEENADI